MIVIEQKGNFKNSINFLERVKGIVKKSKLDKYGEAGCAALMLMTPKDTGLTSMSWSYKIDRDVNSATISFFNDNIQNGINVAILLQYGHGTNEGGYVRGIDYINPAMRPIFEKIAYDAWKEVTNK